MQKFLVEHLENSDIQSSGTYTDHFHLYKYHGIESILMNFAF